MNLLDENIRHDQGERLRKWRIKFRLLTHELSRMGLKDPDVVRVLHRLNDPTFYTHDKDYFRREWVHRSYCLVWLDVFDGEAASFIREFLRHPVFRTHATRMGTVVRVHPGGIHFWIPHKPGLTKLRWQG